MNSLYRSTFSLSKNIFLNNAFLPSISSLRNTYILKRTYTVPLSKVGATSTGIGPKRLKLLKDKYFMYELVEDTNLSEPPDLQVVLTAFVEEIGDVGDVISLMPDYARQHLLLPGKAVYATPENIEKYALVKKTRPDRPSFSSIHAGMTIRRLNKTVFPVIMNHEMPWTIENKHILIAFRIEGLVVPENSISIPEQPITGPDPIKEGKDFAIFLTINNTEKIPVRCRIFHLRPGIESAKLPDECYLSKCDPVLEEHTELLGNMEEPQICDDSPAANISLKERYRIQLIQ